MRTLWVVEPSCPPFGKGWMVRWRDKDGTEWRWVKERVLLPSEPNRMDYADVEKVYPTRAEAVLAAKRSCRHNVHYNDPSKLMIRRSIDGEWCKNSPEYGKD